MPKNFGIKKVGNVQVNSLKIKGSGQNSDFNDSISEKSESVKPQFSLSEELAPATSNDIKHEKI